MEDAQASPQVDSYEVEFSPASNRSRYAFGGELPRAWWGRSSSNWWSTDERRGRPWRTINDRRSFATLVASLSKRWRSSTVETASTT